MGILLLPDLKAALLRSKKWRENLMSEVEKGDHLTLIPHQKKEYLGFYTEHAISMDDLQKKTHTCLEEYKQYFPDTPIDALKLVLFPQIFIS